MLPLPSPNLRKPFYLGLMLCLALSVWALLSLLNQPLSVTFLDVGQGDAILVQTPEYRTVLIDSGKEGKVVGELDKQLNFFNRRLDLVILTHPDRDHFADMLDVMENYKIGQLMLTGLVSDDPLYQAFLKSAKQKQIPMIFPHSQQDIRISSGAFLDILYPFPHQSLIGKEVKNRNNTSLSLIIRDSKHLPLVLLTGDAEWQQEKEILLSGQSVQSTVYKLGHHGSKTSTSQIFLDAIRPQTAVVSAGKDNSFGHPHPEVMERVKDLEIRRTDEEGSMTMIF